jgi:aspartyl-tRNA(Asn)/glutamyl-tRNA(Gln) amidotransferase subunit C
MKISRDAVLHVAELAHLELTEAEIETMLRQLDSILTYIDKLNELDTANVEPLAQALFDAASVEEITLREDQMVSCHLASEVLKGAPDPAPPYFRVPKVIDR